MRQTSETVLTLPTVSFMILGKILNLPMSSLSSTFVKTKTKTKTYQSREVQYLPYRSVVGTKEIMRAKG